MKLGRLLIIIVLITCLLDWTCLEAAEEHVILSDAQAINLGVETVEATRKDFEETLFTLGRIEAAEDKRIVLSTRIEGRVIELFTHPGDFVNKGDEVLVIETLQPGNPPPKVSLHSPINGRVIESHIFLGEPVVPSKHIMTIADLTEVHAVAHVPEHAIKQVRKSIGKKVKIIVPALGEAPFEGSVERLSSEINPENSTWDVHYIIENQESKLLPGMRAEFYLPVSLRTNVLSLPNTSIQETTTEKYVFVKDFELDNAFIKAPVKTGLRNRNFTEIISGVFEYDEVATTGAYQLSFSGNSGISLRDALDAAHGHEHNEDGTEMTHQQRLESQNNEDSDHFSSSPSSLQSVVFFLSASNGIFLILLILAAIKIRSLSTGG